MEMVSSYSSLESDDDYDDEPLLCMPQNTPECTGLSRTPKNSKISWGSMPPDPPTAKDCRAAMFSTSAMPPQMKIVNAIYTEFNFPEVFLRLLIPSVFPLDP